MGRGIRDLIYLQVDLPTILEQEMGCQLMGTGLDSYKCLCPFPFHKDKKASFRVDYKNGGWQWYCFGCANGGTVIEAYAKFYSKSYDEATVELAEKYEIENDFDSFKRGIQYGSENSEQRKALENNHFCLCSICQKALREGYGDNIIMAKVQSYFKKANEILEDKDSVEMRNLLMEAEAWNPF